MTKEELKAMFALFEAEQFKRLEALHAKIDADIIEGRLARHEIRRQGTVSADHEGRLAELTDRVASLEVTRSLRINGSGR